MSKSILDPKNLGPDRPFKQDQKYSNFIQSFIDEYENLIDIKTLIKLQVLESYIMCKPPKKIKEKLQSMCDDNNYPEYTKEQISPYLSPDNKKITRLWKASTKQQQLPYLIGIGNLVNMVVEKYPFPSLIGIPFDIWNEKRILKYIRLRFEIPRKKERDNDVKLPKQSTIKNLQTKTNYTLSDILQYYLKNSKKYDFYYLHMNNQTYKLSKEDRKKVKSRRYNATFFSNLFYLGKYETTGCENIIYTSYNNKIHYITVDYIFNYFYDLTKPGSRFCHSSEREPVFIIHRTKKINNLLIKYSNNLEYIVPYHFLLFDDFESFYTSLERIKDTKHSRITAMNFKENIQDIQDILYSDGFQNKLEERKQVKKHVQDMLKEIAK